MTAVKMQFVAICDSCEDAICDSCEDAICDSCEDAVCDSCEDAICDSCEDAICDSCEDASCEVVICDRIALMTAVWMLFGMLSARIQTLAAVL